MDKVARYVGQTGDTRPAAKWAPAEYQKCDGAAECAAAFAIGLVVTVASAPYFPLLCLADAPGCAKMLANTPQSVVEGGQACLAGDALACGALVGAAITLRGAIKGLWNKVKPG